MAVASVSLAPGLATLAAEGAGPVSALVAPAQGRRLREPRLSCGFDFSARLRQLRAGQANVGETLADDALEAKHESLSVIAMALVESERLLIEVAEQMERFDAHVGALECPLQQAPEVFAAVGVDVSVDVCLSVVDDVVNVVAGEVVVGRMRIGVDGGTGCNMLRHDGREVGALATRDDFQPHLADTALAVTVEQTHDGNLARHRSALRDATAGTHGLVHVAGLAADVGFVNLDFTTELAAALGLQRETEPRQHEPRGLLGHVQRTRQFVAADAVLAVDEQPERGQPLLERDGRVLKDGSDLEGELRPGMLTVALPDAGLLEVGHAVRPTGRALHDAIRPPDRHDGFVSVLVVDEEQNGLLESFGLGCGCHARSVPRMAWSVKYIITLLACVSGRAAGRGVRVPMSRMLTVLLSL